MKFHLVKQLIHQFKNKNKTIPWYQIKAGFKVKANHM